MVIFLFGGVLIGPHGLGLAEASNIQLLSNIGLGFLFLLAGYELDPRLLRQRSGQLAVGGVNNSHQLTTSSQSLRR